MSLPEGLHLTVWGDKLAVHDAALLPLVTFNVACGDPCEWSRTIVERTCTALGVTEAWDADDNDSDDGITVAEAITRWHAELGAEDGFLP